MRYIWPKYPFGRFGHVPGLLDYLAANEEATGGEKDSSHISSGSTFILQSRSSSARLSVGP